GFRPRLGGGPRPAQLRLAVHARAGGADRRWFRGSIDSRRGHGSLAGDPDRRGERMSEIDYSGPERRRGGPDRRLPGEKTRILLVDDHDLFRVGMRNILERERDFVIVAEADDSRRAKDLTIETSPDIILMDLSMPYHGGF